MSHTPASPTAHQVTYIVLVALINLLAETDPAQAAVMSIDSEGNAYNFVAAPEQATYIPDKNPIFGGTLAHSARGGRPAVVLYPDEYPHEPMRVGDLLAALRALPVDPMNAVVIMAHDAEGNRFCPMAVIALATCVPTRYGRRVHIELYDTPLTDEDRQNGLTDADAYVYTGTDGIEATVFYPTI